jgi:hypothetical protein
MIGYANAQITLDEQGNVRVSRPGRDVDRGARAMGDVLLWSKRTSEIMSLMASAIRAGC